jgi:homoserine kinase type II
MRGNPLLVLLLFLFLSTIAKTNAFAAPGMATIAQPEVVKEALHHFLDQPDDATVTPTSSGVNNVVQYVDTKDGRNLILRIYNNGCNTAAVEYEHAILNAIDRTTLPFQVPKYILSKQGKSMEQLKSGTQCCMCERIPGVLPKNSDPKPLGRATGQLMAAMSKIHLDISPPIAPYYRVYDVHKGIGGDKAKFYDYCNGSIFDECRNGIETLCNTLQNIDAVIDEYLAADPMHFPQHIIHGDLHYDNVLTDKTTGEVTGLLDFEFCTIDWRAMEVAVCLSKYVGENDPYALVESFIDGFCEHGILTEQECRAIPDLINLRVLSNCVYFVGRAISGQDNISSLTSRADMYAQRIVWVNKNKSRISESIVRRMKSRGVF